MKTTQLLRQRLELVFEWYQGMVNPDTGMLEYLFIPESDRFVRENCPIRDIASVWDAEVLGDFLGREELRPLIEKSLRHYEDYPVERDGWLPLDPRPLAEPSPIAHSAFMMLALLHAPLPRLTRQIAALADGIICQQRADGSYKVYFHDLPDHGEELYAGGAMLALLEAYRQLEDLRFLQSAERGFRYYDAHYFRRGRVGDDLLVFFANWQSQACRLLFEYTASAKLKQDVAHNVFEMHNRIVAQGFFSDCRASPGAAGVGEVACALDGLNDAYAIGRTLGDERAEAYPRCICTGLKYLLALQCTDRGTTRERGGFGLSLSQRAQRIDITGHAASAFMETVDSAIECRLPA